MTTREQRNARTARTLRLIAELMENPEAQAEIAERAAEEGRRVLHAGLQKLIDRIAPPKGDNER